MADCKLPSKGVAKPTVGPYSFSAQSSPSGDTYSLGLVPARIPTPLSSVRAGDLLTSRSICPHRRPVTVPGTSDVGGQSLALPAHRTETGRWSASPIPCHSLPPPPAFGAFDLSFEDDNRARRRGHAYPGVFTLMSMIMVPRWMDLPRAHDARIAPHLPVPHGHVPPPLGAQRRPVCCRAGRPRGGPPGGPPGRTWGGCPGEGQATHRNRAGLWRWKGVRRFCSRCEQRDGGSPLLPRLHTHHQSVAIVCTHP